MDGKVNRPFPCKARPWNSVPAERFPLSYDLNDLKVLELLGTFHLCFSPLSSFSCSSMPCNGCRVLHGVNPN